MPDSKGREPSAARALVTGGGTGQGLAMARRLVGRGASVMICGHEQSPLERACAELRETAGARCAALTLDLARPEAPAIAVESCVETLGGIDVLINNAGLADFREFDDLTAESWDLSMNLMARAPMLAMQAAARHMSPERGGRIVNNASISASLSEPGSAQYSAAKAALVSLTRTAAVDLAGRGIRVNALAPGWIRTAMSEEFIADVGARGFASINPVGRPGEPDEVAAVAEFLALDAPDYLTGETILVDGGQAIFLPLPG